MESKQAFGSYIKQKRSELGYSQRELAEKLFVTESAVSKWERGVSYPDITQITPLCETLCVSEHELVTASDDWRQRKLEKEAAMHRKTRVSWLIVWTVLYIAIGVNAVFGLGAQSASIIVCCLWLACFTHVPVIVQSNKGVLTFISSYVVLNALFAVVTLQQNQIGIDDIGSEIAGLLFSLSLVVLPFILKLLSTRWASPVFNHKALICLLADSVFLLALVYAFNYQSDTAVVVNQLSGLKLCGIVVVLLIPVWTTFFSIRYLPTETPFRLASAFAFFGFWVFLANGFLNVLTGAPFDLHSAVNFSDWSTYPTVNDNLCWIVLIVCLVVAGALCVAAMKKDTK